MKKSTIIKLSILAILLASILLGVFMMFGSSKFRNSKTKDLNDEKVKFTQTLTEKLSAEGASEVLFSECTYFRWDEAYIFPAYYSAKDAYKTVGCEWTRTKWYYQYLTTHSRENTTTSDEQKMFVFLHEGKPVASGIVNANIQFGDQGYIKMTSSDCKFKIDSQNGGALVYQPAPQEEAAA